MAVIIMDNAEVSDSIELGGHIQLVGFNHLDSSELVVLKKIIGNYARKFSDHLGDSYEHLSINLKKVHGTKSSKFELNVKLLVKGKPVTCDVTENNLYVCVAESLKKIEAQIIK
jgi:ribosome-associated translation inhibitor RaiA